MAFVKTPAYYSRYQVAFRRRREGKTDYAARTALVKQDKSKYNSPKYRFVVRFTNKRVICQIIFSTIQGDRIMASADSTELKRFGITVGLKNYAAAYATGLLLARRLLKKLGMDTMYKGTEQVTGEYELVESNDERRAFRALLDIGLCRSTTGHRVFAAMKGAVDGGIDIPHSETRFAGFDEDELDAEAFKARILGQHVADYMTDLKENDADAYERQFGAYIKAKVDAESLPKMYSDAHAKIRANPEHVKAARTHKPVFNREGHFIKTSKATYYRPTRLSHKERRERVAKKIELATQKVAAQLAAME